MTDHEPIFAPRFAEDSGPGSTPEFSAPYREFLEDFIASNAIDTIVDLGCGDAEIMSRVNMSCASYVGLDVVKERIEKNQARFPQLSFVHTDLRHASLCADLVLCKDVLQHWSNDEIQQWLENELAHGEFRYALITNCNYSDAVNKDIRTGGWRPLDLLAPPFNVKGQVVFQWNQKDVVLIEQLPAVEIEVDVSEDPVSR